MIILIVLFILITDITSTIAYSAIRFNGGGIFFWYQAGCCQYLLENGFSQHATHKNMKIVGTSAGALSATLLAAEADFSYAAEFAIMQAKRDGILDGSGQLAFVWGPIVKEWLEELITDDGKKNALLHHNTYVTVTPAELCKGVKQTLLHDFVSKYDVIEANLASIHIPLFMDKTLCREYRGKKYIDGSFWPFILGQKKVDSLGFDLSSQINVDSSDIYTVDWQADDKFAAKVKEDFVSMISPDRLYDMMESGYEFMRQQHLKGVAPLPLRIFHYGDVSAGI